MSWPKRLFSTAYKLFSMGYEKVRKIRITGDKVYISSCSNNVWPKHYELCEWPSFSKILTEEGREAVEKEILFAYFEGYFQSIGEDEYQRTIYRVNGKLTEDAQHNIWNRCYQDADFCRDFKQRLYDEFKRPPKRQPCYLERKDGWRLRKITSRGFIYDNRKFKTYHNPIEAAAALRRLGLEKYGLKVVLLSHDQS